MLFKYITNGAGWTREVFLKAFKEADILLNVFEDELEAMDFDISTDVELTSTGKHKNIAQA